MVQRCIPLIVSRIVCALPSHCVCVTLTVLFVSSILRIPLSHRPTCVSLVAIPSRSPAKGEERSPADPKPKERRPHGSHPRPSVHAADEVLALRPHAWRQPTHELHARMCCLRAAAYAVQVHRHVASC